MSNINTAKKICLAAHKGQFDKAGAPYYLHPFAVADKCKGATEKIVAYLHDVVEDTDFSIENLKQYGFNRDVIDALKMLTHDKGEPYDEYIAKIKTNEIAKTVKLADLEHNSDLGRLKKITNNDLKRLDKYKKAIDFLSV